MSIFYYFFPRYLHPFVSVLHTDSSHYCRNCSLNEKRKSAHFGVPVHLARKLFVYVNPNKTETIDTTWFIRCNKFVEDERVGLPHAAIL
jgi:hypothetical protein